MFACFFAGSAFAQYPGYGAYDTDNYDTRLHDYGYGYSGGLSYDRPNHPPYPLDAGPNFREPRIDLGPPDPAYVDPRTGAYPDAPGGGYAVGRAPSDYDLGDTASRKTARIVSDPTHQTPALWWSIPRRVTCTW